MNFSKNLSELRKEKNVSIKDLAKVVGVLPATISNWEKGKTKPNINHAIKLARFYGVSLSYLLGF